MSIWNDLYSIFVPASCAICGTRLQSGEESLCAGCRLSLPATDNTTATLFQTEQLFWGRFPIERVQALYFYEKDGTIARLLHAMKYEGRKQLCFRMGKELAAHLSESRFFADIDALLPIPLHTERLRRRGYNQSEWLARGIAAHCPKPLVLDAVQRTRNNATQTRISLFSRKTTEEALFLATPQAECLRHRHIAIVDDVLTTGATVTACADALRHIEGLRISIVVLARARE